MGELQAARMTTESGHSWVTDVSATATQQSLEFYFMGQRVNIGAYDDLADDEGEIMELVTDVQLLERVRA